MGCLPPTFNCSVAIPRPDAPEGWATSFCQPPPLLPPEVEEQDPLPWVGIFDDELELSTNIWTFMTFATYSYSGVEQNYTFGFSERVLDNPDPFEEWNSYESSGGTRLNITMCFAGFNTTLSAVDMAIDTEPSEPSAEWDPAAMILDAAKLQSQFYHSEAGIRTVPQSVFSIRNIEDPAHVDAEALGGNELFGSMVAYIIDAYTRSRYSMRLCYVCTCDTSNVLSAEDAALFMRIINTTGRAGLAFESLLFGVTANAYYQVFQKFDVFYPVTVEFTIQAQVPMFYQGIAAVISMVVVELICVWLIAFLYVTRTRYTQQGNIWQTVSQLMSDSTRPILERSSEMRDSDVSKMLASDDRLVRIGRCERNGKIEVTQC
ncbi:Macrophage colony-stimulating factor 1 receptor [Hypoxylon texense]